MSGGGFYEDDEDKVKLRRDAKGVLRQPGKKFEFDCPDCSANNPYDDGFGDGEELRCHYCGTEFKVLFLDNGKLRFRVV